MTPKDHPRRRRGYRSQAAKDRAELRELRERVRVVPESSDRQVKNPIALSAVDVSKLKRHASRKQYGLQVRGKSAKESRHGRARGHRRRDRIAIDSGATINLLKSPKWIQSLSSRLQAHVRTANGGTSTTNGHGPMSIWVEGADGKPLKLDTLGGGYLMNDLAFSLLSVSRMCDHGG